MAVGDVVTGAQFGLYCGLSYGAGELTANYERIWQNKAKITDLRQQLRLEGHGDILRSLMRLNIISLNRGNESAGKDMFRLFGQRVVAGLAIGAAAGVVIGIYRIGRTILFKAEDRSQ